jgi:hypothetical protein
VGQIEAAEKGGRGTRAMCRFYQGKIEYMCQLGKCIGLVYVWAFEEFLGSLPENALHFGSHVLGLQLQGGDIGQEKQNMLAHHEGIVKVAAAALRMISGVKVHAIKLGPDNRQHSRPGHRRIHPALSQTQRCWIASRL